LEKRLRRFARARSLVLIGRLAPYVGFEHDGLVFFTASRRRGVGPYLFANRKRPEFAVLQRTVDTLRARGASIENTVFVDIGANIGTTTVAALLQQGAARAIAVEPDPENVLLLHANVGANRLTDRVVVVGRALSDGAGSGRFLLGSKQSDRDDGRGRLARDDDANAVEVLVATLDQTLDDAGVSLESVGLVWVDVQGHEGEVLRGASRLLAHRPPLVLAYRPGLTTADGVDVMKRLGDAGYATVVDLRDPSPYVSAFTPTFVPLAEIDTLLGPTRDTTDLLVLPA
jgi:FkbM family methyltransferase